MRIAYLNPWQQAAENQCFKSLEEAAKRIGCELIHCCSSDEILATQPDFVLAVSATQPKLTGIPTYGVIHEPRDRFLCNRGYCINLLSYDGYLTISDSIHQTLRELLAKVGRDDPIGSFYVTCQSSQIQTDQVAKALGGKQAKLTYFGTHWDKRRHSFFKKLSKLDCIEIYGPQHAWRHIPNSPAYKGPLPFDGEGPQKKYAENALGLVLLADKHLLDDVVSNRIFEITSVGAVAICPRMPWIERNYGDSVYYFNQLVPDEELLDQLTGIVAKIQSDPDEALLRARRAHQIFQENFCAEKLLKNACAYHELRARKETSSEEPLVSVIVRCGERIELLDRALNSITAQTAGRFEVLLAPLSSLDLKPILSLHQEKFATLKALDSSGANRAKALWNGLQNVAGKYFAILDEQDEWMPNHIEHLLPKSNGGSGWFAYSGSTRVCKEPLLTGEKIRERRFISAHGDCRTVPFLQTIEFFSPNCFVASSDLLDRSILETPDLQMFEENLLVLELLSKCEPCFNYRATAIQHECQGALDVANAPSRARDIAKIISRLEKKAPQWPIIPDPYPQWSAEAAAFFEKAARLNNWRITIAATPALPALLSPRAVRGRENFGQWRVRTFNRWRRSLHKRYPQFFPKVDDRPRHFERTLSKIK